MHEGRSRGGALLYPVFPYTNYTRVTRADSDALYAYLCTVKPVRLPNAAHQLRFPYNQRALLAVWRMLYFTPGEYRADATRTPEWNRGAYLVQGLGHCDGCHADRNFLGATAGSGPFAGGAMPISNWYAPALAAGGDSGIARWAIEDVAALLRTGVSARGAVYGPMAGVVRNSLQFLTLPDARAIAVYLKSLAGPLPPLDPTPLPPPMTVTGAKLYETHCSRCHRDDGRGVPPHYPPLALNASITASALNPIRMVLNGGFPPSTAGNPRPFGMPPFTHFLNDAEVAAVVTFIRQSWGNRAGTVTAADIARARGVPPE
jgi:mono/diheme cytochrome c family protein